MQLKADTYEQYLELVKESPDLSLKEKSETIIERFRGSRQILSRFAPVTYLLDYSTRSYIFIDETCFGLLGYTSQYFLETGHQEYISKWHPGEFDLLNTVVFSDNFNFLKTLPLERYPDYVFSYNYRFLNGDGEYIKLLQRYSYIPGKSIGNPSGAIGVVFDITHFKHDNSVVHTIEESVRVGNEIVNRLIHKRTHPVYDIPVKKPLSKREMTVLKYIAEGFSSKQIGSKLRISVNTVNNHRKKILSKTHSKNSSELLNNAMRSGML